MSSPSVVEYAEMGEDAVGVGDRVQAVPFSKRPATSGLDVEWSLRPKTADASRWAS
jgi:hypothetical protein